MMLNNISSALFSSSLLANNLWVSSAFALLVGILLGVFYCIGLWWTVKQLNSNRNVAPIFLLSLLARTAVVVAGFYYILGKDWPHLLLGLLGFMIVRFFSTRYITHIQLADVKLNKEDVNAS